jgi:iron complex transport system ATP-binding protein
MSAVIDLQNISVIRGGKPILSSLSFQAQSSERWVILGANGAGKTTLLRVCAAQIQPSSGVARLLGQQLGETNVFELRTRIGFASSALAAQIPNSESVLNAVMTASYGVTGRWTENYDALDERRAKRVLKEWELSNFEDRAFGTLSDGERKRVQIARSIMTDPELLLLDEPVASLDIGARELTIGLLSGYATSEYAPAMALVTHHLEEIPNGFTHALILQDGQVMARGEIGATITSEAISEAFRFPLKVSYQDGRFSAVANLD